MYAFLIVCDLETSLGCCATAKNIVCNRSFTQSIAAYVAQERGIAVENDCGQYVTGLNTEIISYAVTLANSHYDFRLPPRNIPEERRSQLPLCLEKV